ncbi:hypothetical protein BLX41_01205 [Pseudomonas protegens]|uniref:hypothetical protein n=1 Tax=Pseudomonas protegens TaxID=380021 RepID=UPI000F4BD07B|nr:hypothetical protein [Pseudomonas protegens]ROL83196.1 hypothetical protein BLX41_01205 [Pseudomonas protegens]
MNLRKLLPLLTALLLTGCKEDFMSLHFEQPVGYRGQPVNANLSTLLGEAIRSRGIDPERIVLELDEQDSRVIHLALNGELNPEQRAALRALFDEIIQARAASSMAIDLTLQARPETAPPQPIPLELSLSSEVQLSARYQYLDRAIGMFNQSGVPVQIVCGIEGQLNGELPFNGLSVQQIPEQSPEHVYLNFRTQNFKRQTMPVLMQVRDAQLRESMSKGEIRLWGEEQIPNDLLRTKLQLSIEIGNLGEQMLAADFSADSRQDTWTSECAKKIEQLGRPFSFHIGSGIDRLQAVTYEDAGRD